MKRETVGRDPALVNQSEQSRLCVRLTARVQDLRRQSLFSQTVAQKIGVGEQSVLAQEPGEVRPDAGCDSGLQRRRGQAPAGRIGRSGDEPVGDIIAIAARPLGGLGRGETIAGFISQLADERRGGNAALRRFLSPHAPGTILQTRLHPLPLLLSDDRRMSAGVLRAAMPDAADVDRVGQQVMQLPAPEGPSAQLLIAAIAAGLGAQSESLCPVRQDREADSLLVEIEDPPHLQGFLGVHHQHLLAGIGVSVVAQGQRAAHPQPAPFGRRDLVADALARSPNKMTVSAGPEAGVASLPARSGRPEDFP